MSIVLRASFSLITALTTLPVIVVFTSWFLKYSFAVFDAITLGLPEPPVLSYEMVNPLNEQRPLGTLLVVLVFYFMTKLLIPLVGEEGVLAIRLAALLLLPASVAA